MDDFEIGEERPVWRAAFLEAVEQRVVAPDGESLTRFVVRHPGAVAMVAVDGEERVALVRQFRSAIGDSALEIPAGKREPGEAPDETAHRELVEELGIEASDLEYLGEFVNSPGFCDERTAVYLTRTWRAAATRAEAKAEERFMTVEWVDLAATPELVASGELADAKSIIGLHWARRVLSAGREP